jgi:tRNA A37 threonylcarbamoyladenosine modification protein TsaB
MNIEIIVKDKRINLVLRREEEFIDSLFWQEGDNLSQKLVLKIDELIKRNNLTSSEIEKIKVKTNISEKFTTVRIAKVVAKTFNFANKK